MRYGNPSIKTKLNFLKDLGCENIVVLPLYPQYAAATTATVCDEVYRSLMNMRWQPSLQIIPHYESNPYYINAIVKSIKKKVESISWKPDLIISSYHGIPKKYFDKGDPYHCYCHKTSRLIKESYDLDRYSNYFPIKIWTSRVVNTIHRQNFRKFAKQRNKKFISYLSRICFRLCRDFRRN